MPDITTTPARWPYATVRIEQTEHPALVLAWERGHGQTPAIWCARVVYANNGQAVEALVPAMRVTRVGS